MLQMHDDSLLDAGTAAHRKESVKKRTVASQLSANFFISTAATISE